MLPTISQVCSLNSPFQQDLEDYAAGHCGGVEIWLTKFEGWLQTHSLDDFQRLRDKLELQTPVASFQGGLLASQGERRKEAWDLLDRRLLLCQQAGIGTIVVACDVPRAGFDQQMLERVVVSLQDLSQRCGRHGVRAAIEFQASAPFGNNVKTLAMLLQDIGHRTSASASTPFTITRAAASPLICSCSRRRIFFTCSSATSPICRGSWRPTAAASCPAKETSTSPDPAAFAADQLPRLRLARNPQPTTLARPATANG